MGIRHSGHELEQTRTSNGLAERRNAGERSLDLVSWDDTYVNRGPMWRGEVELHPVGGKSGD